MASQGQAPLAPFATAVARLEESVPDDGPTDGDEKMQATSLHALGIPDDEESRGQVSPVPLYTSARAEGENNDVETNTRSSSQTEAQSALVHPPDRGLHARLFLAGSFSTETVVSSLVFSFGIFEDYYRSHPPYKAHPKGTSAIGTTVSGMLFLTIAPCCFALHFFPFIRRLFPTVGVALMALGLVLASLSHQIWQLAVCEGVIHGLGAGMLYGFALSFLDEWFVKNKRLAYGVMIAGSGFAGVSVPWLATWGLESFGLATVLRAWAVVVVLLMAPFLNFLKPRIYIEDMPPVPVLSFLRHRKFVLAAICIVVESLGFFLPFLYLPTHARSLDLTVNQHIGSRLRRLRKATDHHDVTKLFAFTSGGAAIAALLMWGFATSFPAIIAFALIYGVLAGSYSTVWTGVPIEMRKENPKIKAGLVLSLLLFCRGVGAVVSGPMGDAILGRVGPHQLSLSSETNYGTSFGGLVAITGTTASVGAFPFIARKLKRY